jgi:hypothetical protein
MYIEGLKGPFMYVSAFGRTITVLNASFSAIYQHDLTIVWKYTIFKLDVRLENYRK